MVTKRLLLILLLTPLIGFSQENEKPQQEAKAEEFKHWYVGGGLVFGTFSETSTTLSDGSVMSADFDSAFGIELLGGYRFDENQSVELSLKRASYEVGDLTWTTYPGVDLAIDGEYVRTSLKADYKYHYLPSSSINPFVGIGAGFTNIKADNINLQGSELLSGLDTAPIIGVQAGAVFEMKSNIDFIVSLELGQIGSHTLESSGESVDLIGVTYTDITIGILYDL